MSRLIDADALKTIISEHVYLVRDYFNSTSYGMFWTGGIEKAIDEMPTVEERKTGKWIYVRTEPDGNAFYYCSECGKGEVHVPIVEVKYCWNCGARMV